jgi:signaling repeat-containing protein
MHFIAMLGFTIPGETIRYNVPVTLLSMLIAVAFVSIGLLIIGVSVTTFVLTATIALSPTADEISAEAELMRKVGSARAQPVDARAPVIKPGTGSNSNFTRLVLPE